MTGLEAAIAGNAIKESVQPAKSLIKRFGRPAYERLVVEYSQCFQSHLDDSYNRCRYVKNVLYRDNSVELEKQYVNVNFRQADSLVGDAALSDIILKGGRILVSGTAGAGKTMFMKWLTLDLIKRLPNHKRVPLFLELRYISEATLKGGLISYILEATSPAEKRVTLERFKIGLELGQFIIVLDAVDEIKPDLRERVIEEIRILFQDYPHCPVLLSSRPDEELSSLQDLTVYRTTRMTQEQIVEVIEKLEFDKEVKSRLIDRLNSGLFSEHEEFLSNPLLATIMLLNFDHSADIPTRLTSFYRQAFEALYQRHDAAKGAYRRGHFAGLPLDEYEKVFSAFCFDSFLDSKVQFTDVELSDYFKAAATYCGVSSEPNALVQDAMKSVCVIQREGLENVFVHRSFQEYFTALFLSRYRDEDFPDQVEGTVFGWQSNNVLKMLLELAPEAVEQKWLEPKIRAFLEPIRRVKPHTITGSTKIFKALYSTIKVEVTNGAIVGFSGHAFPDQRHAANWLSNVGIAYTPIELLSREIFHGQVMFDNLEDYLASSGQAELINAYALRYEHVTGNIKQPATIDFGTEDLATLMKSGLPTTLGLVRDALILFHEKLLTRINERATAMARLRTRHLMTRPVRRPRAPN